jgi:hypothetical protein
MTLDSSVMNVSIATVAKDVGTTVTGIQTAITFYTLVMASLMITGGKLGQILGRKRAFAIGCVIYACGSFTTAIAPNLAVLMFGWSFLEGVGAALIMPAIVALVASNFARAERPRAYGLVASAGAIAVAAGPLIGGLFTTYASWRWVFIGEVLVVFVILALTRRMADTPAEEGARLDLVGTGLSAFGLGLVVFGILRSGEWGFVQPKEGATEWLGLSPVIWLIWPVGRCSGSSCGGRTTDSRGDASAARPRHAAQPDPRGRVTSFSSSTSCRRASSSWSHCSLGRARTLGDRDRSGCPLSITLLSRGRGIPRSSCTPHRAPGRPGSWRCFAGIVVLVAALDAGAGPGSSPGPCCRFGLGVRRRVQLGSVTVSSVPDEQSGGVGESRTRRTRCFDRHRVGRRSSSRR